MEKFGYVSVAGMNQDPEPQMQALISAGVARDQITIERVSGSSAQRPALKNALGVLAPGSVLVIWRLDRLGRTGFGILEAIRRLTERGIMLVSIEDAIDATTTSGRTVQAALARLARIDRDLLEERGAARLAASRAERPKKGRPDAMTPEIQARAIALLAARPRLPIDQIARHLPVSRSRFYQWKADYEKAAEISALTSTEQFTKTPVAKSRRRKP